MSEPKRPGATVPATPVVVEAGGRARPRSDVVATEEPLEIRVQHRGAEHIVMVTMRTPGNDFELAVGTLYAEGAIAKPPQVRKVSYCASGPPEQNYNIVTVELTDDAPFEPAGLERHAFTSSSCGVCGKAAIEHVRIPGDASLPSGPVIDADLVVRLPSLLRERQPIFARTGGLHAAGLFTPAGEPRIVREDVGRHNAVDKLIGKLLLSEQLPAGESVLQVSGRASFELVQKAAVAGIPVLCAVGAPSSLAVECAQATGMTLVGFSRGESFAVYTGPDRIAATRSKS